MVTLFICVAAGLIAIAALAVFLRRLSTPETYVYIEDDGTVRDLTPDDVEYLATPFLPGDGARPHIKWRYNERTPDGGLRGYLPRRKVPRRLRY